MTFHDVFTPLLVRSKRLAYRLLGDEDAAAEVASEALTRLLEHWQTVGADPDHRTAWTLRVTRNLAIDVLRRRARETGLPDHDLAVVDTGSELELRIAVLDAVRDLPERQRRIIELRYLLDLRQTDVAAALGVHPGTVSTQVSRALVRLRKALDASPTGRSRANRRKEHETMKVTTLEQARELVGTDQPVIATVTGGAEKGRFAVDIGMPAVYRGRGQRRPRWAPKHPSTLIGEEFDCVVVDIDDEQRPVVTDALTGDDAAEFAGRQDRVRQMQVGQRFPGRVAVVTPIGAFVDFDGLRGLVHVSELDPDASPTDGQDVEVEVVAVDPVLARISLRVRACPPSHAVPSS